MRSLAGRILDDPELTQCTFYFRFYVIRAMAASGLGDRYLTELEPWRDMLALGLTTFAEKPEPTRSDCHGWSACPNYDLLALVCGILPDAPGFAKVCIAPNLGALPWVEAAMPHPNGEIRVRFDRAPNDGLRATVTLPPKVPGRLVWRGREYTLQPGIQSIDCSR